MRRLVIVSVGLALIPTLANAQHHAAAAMPMVSMPARSVAVAPAAGMRVAPAPVVHTAGAHIVSRGTTVHGRPTSTMVRVVPPRHTNNPHPTNQVFAQDQQDGFGDNFYPTPGLGFDMAHLAAVHGPGAVGAGRHHHNRSFGAFFPFFDGGFFLPQTVVEEPVEEAQPAENVVADNPEPARRERYYRDSEPVATIQDNPAPPPENSQYVFVRRDGSVIFAVAYSFEGGSLRYVTSEGQRRSLSLDSLDLDATRQFFEQRGLSFRLPA